MDVGIIIKIAGVGLLVAVINQVLIKSGRDEQATFVTLSGIIVVMLFLISELSKLFTLLRSVFGL